MQAAAIVFTWESKSYHPLTRNPVRIGHGAVLCRKRMGMGENKFKKHATDYMLIYSCQLSKTCISGKLG